MTTWNDIEELEAIRQKVREAQSFDQLRQALSMLITLLLDLERDRSEPSK